MILMAGAQAEKNAREKQEKSRLAQAQAEQAAREKRDRHTLICPACRVEYANKARCCIKCGSTTAITVAQLKEYDAAEKAAQAKLVAAERAAQARLVDEARRREEAQTAMRLQRLSAKRRHDAILQRSFCRPCFTLQQPKTNFCPVCTQPCDSQPPLGVIYDILHSEYPALVDTPDDVQSVADTLIPPSADGVGSTVHAAKVVAGWGVEAAGKSIKWFFR